MAAGHDGGRVYIQQSNFLRAKPISTSSQTLHSRGSRGMFNLPCPRTQLAPLLLVVPVAIRASIKPQDSPSMPLTGRYLIAQMVDQRPAPRRLYNPFRSTF